MGDAMKGSSSRAAGHLQRPAVWHKKMALPAINLIRLVLNSYH